MVVNSGSLSLTNVTIANNTVGVASAGGLALGSGTATLNNVTISGNAASVDGGGLTQASGTFPADNVEVGDEITCAVTASNSGNGDSENTELELEFTNLEYNSSEAVTPSESSLLNANAVLGSCTGSNPVTCGLGTLSAGETYQVNVLATVLAEGSFSMNASLSGNSSAATASGSGSGTASGGVVPIAGGGCSLNVFANESLMQGKGIWILFAASVFVLFSFKRKNNIIHVIVS